MVQATRSRSARPRVDGAPAKRSGFRRVVDRLRVDGGEATIARERGEEPMSWEYRTGEWSRIMPPFYWNYAVKPLRETWPIVWSPSKRGERQYVWINPGESQPRWPQPSYERVTIGRTQPVQLRHAGLAFSPSARSLGFSWRWETAEAAQTAAKKHCYDSGGASDTIAVTAGGALTLVLVYSREGAYGWAGRVGFDSAQRAAIGALRDVSPEPAVHRAWVNNAEQYGDGPLEPSGRSA